MEEKEMTILIPALNEEETIHIVVERASGWLEENSVNGEILVVDNNSTDQTREIATSLGARVVYEEKQGYGSAIKRGINEAYGRYIIMGDADDSYRFSEIGDMYKALLNGSQLVLGNRYYNMEKGAMPFLHRYIGTPTLSFLIRHKYKVKIKDINCGLRGFTRNEMQGLKLKTDGMELASEMIIKAAKANLKISQVNINFYKDKRNKKGHLRTIRDGIRHLNVILD